jgi:hypothetical protein
MEVLQKKIKIKQDENIVKFRCWNLHKMKETQKITILPTKLKGITYKHQKKMPHSQEGGVY